MAAKKDRKTTAKKTKAAPKTAVQEALQVTFILKGQLKILQMAYLRVGELLVRVRDEKLYAELKHPDMESYAQKRLKLGRSSLYHYIQVYDWVRESHKEWLDPKPGVFIPDLNDAEDLRWIENELKRTDLQPEMRAQLEALQKKGVEGGLGHGELDRFRHHAQSGAAAMKSFFSKLRLLRTRGSALASMPADVIACLDAAIAILQKNTHTPQVGG